MAEKDKLNILFVGAGVPGRSMGWVHVIQAVEDSKRYNVVGAVEPWFCGQGKGTSKEFEEFKNSCKFPFFATVPEAKGVIGDRCMALISCRTVDNPGLFKQCVEIGVTHIFMEKPGAPSTEMLQECLDLANSKNVQVMMGYNKNVAAYVKKALARSNETGEPILFFHQNGYTQDTLAECFVRNGEGMLRNMACHELALVVSLIGIDTTNLKSATVDKSGTEMLTLEGKTDFAALKFTLESNEGKTVTIHARRCGGQLSRATVGTENYICPTEEDNQKAAALEKARPGMMGYFYSQWDDYIALKNDFCDHILAGKQGPPPGKVSLANAVQVLMLCDRLTKKFQAELSVQPKL